MQFNSIESITKKILELERNNNLLDWTLKEIKIYQVIRYLIYINAIESNIERKKKSDVSSPRLSEKIRNQFSRVKNFIFYNPFYDRKNSKTLLFESGRKQTIKGLYVDPFTVGIKESLVRENEKFSIYQTANSYDRLSQKKKNVKHLDYIYLLSALKQKFLKIEFSKGEREQINKYGNILMKELNLSLDFFPLIKNQLSYFITSSVYFGKLLDIKRPEKIYIVNFCDKASLINECKKRKIKVFDIQHGFISSKDIIYHYPDTAKNKLDYFPDKFFAWSDLWMGECILPILKDNIENIDNYSLNLAIEKYKNVNKDLKKVLILSQETLTTQIINETFDLVVNNPEYNFFYKPHPNEYSYVNDIKRYQDLLKRKNFFVVSLNEDLNKYFAECKFVLGAYTTSLIEALYFNCEIFVFDLPGSEMMNFLINGGRIKKIKESPLSFFSKNTLP